MEGPSPLSPGPDAYRIVFVADTHFSSDHILDFHSLIADVSLLSNDEIIATAVLGDLVQDGRESDYSAYRESTGGLTVFNVIGNHDVYNSGWAYYKEYLGPSSYTVSIGEAGSPGSLLLINLDSANATLGVKQTQWLEDLLETERSRYTYCIVMTHSNFFPESITTIVQFSDKAEVYSLVDLFRAHDVDFVLSGHSHQFTRYRLFNTEYVTLDSIKDSGSRLLVMTVGPAGIACEYLPVSMFK